MASSGEKKWNRPWSMDEMIENAENWSLAGDVVLLNTLKAYSEKLFSRTVSISDNVDNLLHSLDEVSLKLNLSQNEFQSLRNTQFIESRVYEDDETLDFKEEVKPEQKVPSEEEKERLLKESVLEGLRVMDKYFEKIEVSISDSEDEESEKSYILRPKDIYADRPLPLIIGSEEWYKKWHVGLADSSSESESEKVSETYSDSESGDDLPKDLMKGSETSSELDFSSQTSDNRPVANSTFNESAKKPNVFASDEESDGQGSVPVKTPISSKSFAEQLAAKLGDVISEREDISVEINRKPIQPALKNKFAGDLFSDEPPPLDDLEDTILPKSAQEGLFSGGRGLFDDNEDDLFWGQQSKEPSVNPPDVRNRVKKETVESDEKGAVSTAALPKLQVIKGPFDTDSDSSDEDIFKTKKKIMAKQPFLQPYMTTAPLFNEEPPELEAQKKPMEESLKKKPVGGVSIFGKSDIFSGEKAENILKARQQDFGDNNNVEHKVEIESNQPVVKPDKTNKENVKPKQPNLFDDVDKGFDTVQAPANPKPQKVSLFDDDEEIKSDFAAKPKKISLFDDDDDLFKDDLFSGIDTKKFTSNLFDDVEDNSEDLFPGNVKKNEAPKIDLFCDLNGSSDASANKNILEPKTAFKPKKNLNLFEEEEEDLFGTKQTMPGTNISQDNTKTDDVKEEIVVSNRTVNADDEVDIDITKIVEDLPQRQVIGAEKLATERKATRGLFDDDLEENETEDLFKETEVKKKEDKAFGGNENLETDKKAEKNQQNTELEAETVPQSQTINPKPETSNATDKSQSRSGINLFGSSPPPDDEDWDTKSAQSSDNEDQFSYRIDYNAARSSLFDNEPPSLGPNDSSGIVRDANITRMDNDDSSFNPYASSSRRLSSDVFSDQQSQDSFFVTKNKTESLSIPPQLDRIPEVGKSSNLDITPSGNMEDLENSKGDSSVFQDKSEHSETTSDSKKPISLFDNDFDSSTDADDLFSSISKKDNVPKLSDKRLSLFDNINNVLEENVKRENPDPIEEEDPVKDSTKSEEPPKEAGEIDLSTGSTTSGKETKKPPTGSPGKLKHNLKINVGALIPGAAPPRLRDLPKSQSLDLPKDQTITPTHPSSPDGGFFTPTISNPRKDTSTISSERAVSFEDALDNIEVLHSVTKDRAKIPIKRRPSTRRGRQKAIQDTSPNIAPATGDDNAGTAPVQLEPIEIKSKTVEQEPSKRLPDLTPRFLEIKTPPSVSPASDEKLSKMDSMFDDLENNGDSLFPGSSTKNVAEEKSKSSIFESEDSDSDLFGHTGPKRAKKEGTQKKNETAKKKPLFNDNSSDEDLFSGIGGGSSRRKENTKKVVGKKIPKPSTTRKLENIETDEDPLSSLLK